MIRIRADMGGSVGGAMGRAQELTEGIVHHFLSMVRYQHRLGHSLQQEFNISGKQSATLRYLVEHGPATVSCISQYLYVSDSTASPLLERMEQAGYVTRRRSEEDNRKVVVEPTELGRQLIQEIPLGMISRLRAGLPELDIDELERIHDALAKLSEVSGVQDLTAEVK